MKNDKVNYLIDIINEMGVIDKLRLAVRMNESSYINIDYNRKEMCKYFSKQLEKLDGEYKKFPVINSKYINFIMAKIMEMTKEEQNQVVLFLFNNIILI